MLAGERFSDRPESVCEVVAGFLRSYNDGIGAEERDDLYRFASDAVGTCADSEVTEARAQLCRDWIVDHRDELYGPGRLLPGGLTCWLMLSARTQPSIGALTGRLAARLTRRGRPGAHAAALALVDRMIEAGREGPPAQDAEHAPGTRAMPRP